MDGLLNTLTFARKMSVDIMKFDVAVQKCFVMRAVCSIIDFFSSSYQKDVKFMFWKPKCFNVNYGYSSV